MNYAILLIWFFAFVFAHDVILELHTRWFRLSPEYFDAFHYEGMEVYKIRIFLLNLAPLIAIWLLGNDV